MLAYSHRARQLVECHHVVAGKDAVSIKRYVRVAGRLTPSRNQDLLGGNPALTVPIGVAQLNGVRIAEGCLSGNYLDSIAQELMTQDIDFMPDHRPHPAHEILHRNLLLDRVGHAVDEMLPVS